jgi:hypothetical protein
MGGGQSKNTPLECMVKNFNRGFSGYYGVKLTPNKLKVLCEVDWPAFGVGWLLKGLLNKIVVNKVYRVIVKKIKRKKIPNTQDNGKSQEAKIYLQKLDSVVYLSLGSNLLGRLRRNQSL